uniref:Uncharacterized protein n=1 Tax=Arundo donax TaxID=35708 RepID=A0A0A8Y5R4_ARUDO
MELGVSHRKKPLHHPDSQIIRNETP